MPQELAGSVQNQEPKIALAPIFKKLKDPVQFKKLEKPLPEASSTAVRNEKFASTDIRTRKLKNISTEKKLKQEKITNMIERNKRVQEKESTSTRQGRAVQNRTSEKEKPSTKGTTENLKNFKNKNIMKGYWTKLAQKCKEKKLIKEQTNSHVVSAAQMPSESSDAQNQNIQVTQTQNNNFTHSTSQVASRIKVKAHGLGKL